VANDVLIGQAQRLSNQEVGMTVNRNVALVLGIVAIITVFAGAMASATSLTKATYLTFSGPVALPGVTLSAGEYLFELADPYSTRKVVRVTNRLRSRVYLTAITRPVPRPGGLRDGLVTLGEARPGSPRPITAWFPENESVGYGFIY
jgi:hypothetical protein